MKKSISGATSLPLRRSLGTDELTIQHTTHDLVQKHKVKELPSEREGLQAKHVLHFRHWSAQKGISKKYSEETYKTYLNPVQQLIVANLIG
ncbi:hypothetical protein J6590_037645 [Homalodisca vitripennis]|nr:hypothetical protein J6590_037645 [Homalodisca vitripennis]